VSGKLKKSEEFQKYDPLIISEIRLPKEIC